MQIIADSIRESKSVDDVVILAMDAPHHAGGNLDEEAIEVYVPDRFVGEEMKRHKGLHFGGSVHPDHKDSLEELEWSKENGAVLVKWLPNIQGIDVWNGLPPHQPPFGHGSAVSAQTNDQTDMGSCADQEFLGPRCETQSGARVFRGGL